MQQRKDPDFADLEDMNLPLEILESVRQARIEARSIISKLEPFHITSWADFMAKLEAALKSAKNAEKIFA